MDKPNESRGAVRQRTCPPRHQTFGSALTDITPVPGRFVALCWLIFCVVWFVAAFWTKRTVDRHGQWNRWPFWVLALAAFVVLIRRRTGLFRIELWSYTPAIGVVADIVTLAGLLVALWARTTLGSYWSSNVVVKEDHAIVDRGPYRCVRHPIYSGVLLMMLGTMVLWGRLMAFLVFLGAFWGLWVKLRREERLMTEHLPEAYARYKARVKSSLVPFVL